jgi:predicted permease
MDAWWHDLRFALRTAVRRPAFLLGATLSLALAIGANTAIFSLINELFLRSLPVVAPERVFNITTVDERLGGPAGGRPLSHLNWRDVRDQSTAFEAVAGYDFVGLALDTGVGEPGVVPGLMVSANYFDVLGLKPAYGRFFRPEDDAGPGSGPVVVLRHGYFRDELGGDPDVIGRSLRINGQPVTVVGVAGPGFDGLNVGFEPALWAPMSMHRTLRPNPAINWYDERRGLFLVAFGRLAPGVTPESARAEVETIASRLERDYPDDNQGRGLALEPVSSNAVFNRDAVATGTALLAATVGLVLLVAAANVANLLLARASERRQEIAIRLAMGISRQRLLRQLLTESVMIAVLGGGLGLLLAILSRGWLAGILGNLPAGGNLALDLTLDRNVLLFNLLVSLATGFLFGLIPAIQFSRPQLVAAIREASAPTLAPGHRFAARDALVVAQLALSAVALVGAGLFLRSLAAGSRIDLGYPSQGLATLGFDVGLQGLGPAEAEPLFRQVRESVAALPGVSATALVQAGPLQGTLFRSVVLEGSNDQERTYVQVSAAGSGYFETMGIALERGRAIDERDRAGGQPVVVINSAMAERFWPGQDPHPGRSRVDPESRS